MEQTEFLYGFYRTIGIMSTYGTNPLKSYVIRHPDGRITTRQPYILLREFYDMASPKKSKKQSPFGNITFISYKMDKETQAAFNEWFTAKGNTVVNAILEVLQAENKLSLSWDDEHECFIGAMTGKEDSLNHGKCITMRSKEWFKAQAALAYIHTVIFSGEIWEGSEETDII